MIEIPYLSEEMQTLYRSLAPEVALRLLEAAKAVAGREMGFRNAAGDHDVRHLRELLEAIVRPVRDQGVPAPWAAPSLAAEASNRPARPNLSLVLAEVGPGSAAPVVGVDVIAEYIEDGRLTPQQGTAAVLLALGKSVTETATAVGIGRQQVHVWLRHPALNDAINRIVLERSEALIRQMDELQRRALSVFEEGLTATRPSRDAGGEIAMLPDWTVRLASAKEILDRGGRMLKGERIEVAGKVEHEVVDLDVQIEEARRRARDTEAELRRVEEALVVMRGGRDGR